MAKKVTLKFEIEGAEKVERKTKDIDISLGSLDVLDLSGHN